AESVVPGDGRLEVRRRPRCTLFPYTTLFRSIKDSRKRLILPATEASKTSLPTLATKPPRRFGSVVTVTSTLLPNFASSVRASERSEEHTSELQSPYDLVCRLLLEKQNEHAIP